MGQDISSEVVPTALHRIYAEVPEAGDLRKLQEEHRVELIGGHAQGDHVKQLLSIPHKCSVANTVGLIRGKSEIRIHRERVGVRRTIAGAQFWAYEYCVSTVGPDVRVVRNYVGHQQEREKREEQHKFPAQRGPSLHHRSLRGASSYSLIWRR